MPLFDLHSQKMKGIEKIRRALLTKILLRLNQSLESINISWRITNCILFLIEVNGYNHIFWRNSSTPEYEILGCEATNDTNTEILIMECIMYQQPFEDDSQISFEAIRIVELSPTLHRIMRGFDEALNLLSVTVVCYRLIQQQHSCRIHRKNMAQWKWILCDKLLNRKKKSCCQVYTWDCSPQNDPDLFHTFGAVLPVSRIASLESHIIRWVFRLEYLAFCV